MNKDLLNKILKLEYVQRIELEPGIFTCDNDQLHLALVNELLEPIDFQSLACLDIGTRDGGTAFLLEKCGASSVVALDAMALSLNKLNIALLAFTNVIVIVLPDPASSDTSSDLTTAVLKLGTVYSVVRSVVVRSAFLFIKLLAINL